MDDLMDLVRRYQGAQDLAARLAVAEPLFGIIGPPVLLYITHRCRDAHKAEDACQEALKDIGKDLLRFRGQSKSAFWAFCYKIASRRLADSVRTAWANRVETWDKDELERIVAAGSSGYPASFADKHDLEWALDLLQRTHLPCYHLLWMRYIEELNFKAMGQALRVTAATAKMRVYRCLELAQELIDKGD